MRALAPCGPAAAARRPVRGTECATVRVGRACVRFPVVNTVFIDDTFEFGRDEVRQVGAGRTCGGIAVITGETSA